MELLAGSTGEQPVTKLDPLRLRILPLWRPHRRRPTGRREWFHTYTRDLSREDLERLFTHDTRDAYDFFARGLDEEELAALPWWRRIALRFRQVFVAFTLKLPAARRAVYFVALVIALIGVLQLFRGFAPVVVPLGLPFLRRSPSPLPVWAERHVRAAC